MIFQRFLCSQTAARHSRRHEWPVKQVVKSNFSEALAEFKDCITNSDFVAVSLQKTGGHSAPWQRILPIDTAETAYIKSKHAATRFQILQFSVCPFSVKDSKLIVHPYNFHLFPRDELKVGMPSYNFSCQSSYLTSMAREGFDFNACIYNGAQESSAKIPIGHLSPISVRMEPLPTHSVADSLFAERIKTRVKNWIKASKDSNKTEDAMLSTLRKLISGNEIYGSRPSLTLDVCSERQVQIVIEALKEHIDVVPLQVPLKGGGVQAVRVVLTSSKEDKNLLEKEIQDKEQERRKHVLGFREVIDFISASHKPVVAHNSLKDFASVHSTFLAPLPMTRDEFMSSLLSVFPHVVDINHLMKEIGAFEKMNNISGAISYLDSRLSAPINMEISKRAETDKVDIHGHNVLRVCQLFVKLCSVMKISLEVPEGGQLSPSLQHHSNMFNPSSTNHRDPEASNVRISTGNSRMVRTNNLVFVWGFKRGISARNLKDLLCDLHDIFSEEFDVRMIDRTCAIFVFWTPGYSERFLGIIESGDSFAGKLNDLISEGLRASGYETYKRVCEMGFWRSDLAECLDRAVDENAICSVAKSQQEQSVIYWNDDDMINLDDL
ncbi:hypothetical protein CASFOL_039685 [Castilleja foliolosa]|uniref:Uncharacterized protein n=1 Tax=Castilleja foliolosa TaxID=1961234 RepID=A0ABD3BFX0_9LAMI